MSAWVNEALRDKAASERRLAALADAVRAYEGEHGEIDPTELADQARADRDAAAAVRAKTAKARKKGAA
ncbi:MAG TPA: hypothetical protein VFW74_19025 [Acidimicrobiia bacterium]|nr:hypothetical protein [Acidimicrobiia bacterium]